MIFSLFLFTCVGEDTQKKKERLNSHNSKYLNHSDSAKYVGMATCKLCHQSIYNTYIKTGMGQSFDIASKEKSSAIFLNAKVYDTYKDFQYQAYWADTNLFIREFRVFHKDTIHQRRELVDFIIGSGQHTNSHLQLVNGYLYQMPMTFYTQKKKWDLPPGFENNTNTRFSRKIGLECMTCHNAYPEFVVGSENKYTKIAHGIDCERCHGPGSIHVVQRQTGIKVDTLKYIDYSIVNPSKLDIDLQFDICQRCHLQGNTVVKEGKSFFDFKPGQKLSDVISVFLPKYKNADDEFIMASHADRIKQSACFIKSYENVKGKHSLKPYQGALTCITCHNPHISVKETKEQGFIVSCLTCHYKQQDQEKRCSTPKVKAQLKSFYLDTLKNTPFSTLPNCITCHMPVSGSIDIPHVSVHDHFIRKPAVKLEKEKIKIFLGLCSVNEKNPSNYTRATAYLNYYEKFDQKKGYLDSATYLLKNPSKTFEYRYALIQLAFFKQDYHGIINYIDQWGEENCYTKQFTTVSYDNKDAWLCYRVGEAYQNLNNAIKSVKWFSKCVTLAPYNLEFRNKYASALMATQNIEKAKLEFEYILSENPATVSAYTNLGYLCMLSNQKQKAFQLYQKAMQLDPDNEALLLNLSAYYLSVNNSTMAVAILKNLIKKHPTNIKAKQVLKQLGI